MQITGLIVCLAAFAPVQRDDITTMDKRSFRIPIFVNPVRAKEIDWLYLYVSCDKGKTWKKVIGATPDQKFFAFSAPKNGLYWFAVQIVSKDLKLSPPSTRDMQPGQKVLVSMAARVPARSDKEEIAEIEEGGERTERPFEGVGETPRSVEATAKISALSAAPQERGSEHAAQASGKVNTCLRGVRNVYLF